MLKSSAAAQQRNLDMDLVIFHTLFQGQSPVYNFYLHPQHKPCTSSPPSTQQSSQSLQSLQTQCMRSGPSRTSDLSPEIHARLAQADDT